jgi:hypothetical protein
MQMIYFLHFQTIHEIDIVSPIGQVHTSHSPFYHSYKGFQCLNSVVCGQGGEHHPAGRAAPPQLNLPGGCGHDSGGRAALKQDNISTHLPAQGETPQLLPGQSDQPLTG